MNIDEIINQAADHIERYPESYNFGQGMVINKNFKGFGPDPGPGGPIACMLSRIGEIAGYPLGTQCNRVSTDLLGLQPDCFYGEIRAATAAKYESGPFDPVHNTQTIPNAMRALAKRYEGIPAVVRKIFDAPPVLWSSPLVEVFEAGPAIDATRYRQAINALNACVTFS